MGEVKNLDSQFLTAGDIPLVTDVARAENESTGFVSGDFGVSARFSFRLNSPWKAIKTWLKRAAA